MSIRADKYRRNAQSKIYKGELNAYKSELKNIPWWTMDKEKRKYRTDLKIGISEVKRLLAQANN